MKQHLWIGLLALICALALTGCQCAHHWQSATCTDGKICSLCDQTEGEPLGHTWKAATCAAPKICEICKITDGKPREHSWKDATCAAPRTCGICGMTEGEPLPHIWTDAACVTPKTCALCGATDGSALGHSWQAATCTAPKTCSVCKETQGQKLDHRWQEATTEQPKTCTVCKSTEGRPVPSDERFTMDPCKALFGSWESRTEYTAGDFGLTDQTGSFAEVMVLTFHDDGTVTTSHQIDQKESCEALLIAHKLADIYAQYGSQEAAQQQMPVAFGVTPEEYAAQYAQAYLREHEKTSVSEYYVSRNRLYLSEERYDFSIHENRLRLVDEDGDCLDLTRK